MGTEFVYAINLLANPQGREAVPCRGSDDKRGYSGDGKQERVAGRGGWARESESMGEPVGNRCLESIRRKMQAQEDTFRKQVRELHRLYNTQKKIMGELKEEMEGDRFSSPLKSHNTNDINRPHQMDQMAAAGCAFHFHRLYDDQCLQDRSASCSGDATRIQRGCLDLEIRPSRGHNSVMDKELPRPNFTAPDKRVAECINDRLGEESDVELTLSIGRGSSTRKPKSCTSTYREPEIRSSATEHSSTLITLDHRNACDSNTSNTGGSSTTSDQERGYPHPSFQV